MKSLPKNLIFALVLPLMAKAQVVRADVAFTSFAADGSDEPYTGPNVEGNLADPVVPHEFAHAAAFEPAFTGNLQSIALGLLQGNPNSNVTVSLTANNPAGGPLMSTIYASGTVTAHPYPAAGYPHVYPVETYTYNGPAITLDAGVTYWIVLVPTDPTSYTQWGASTINNAPEDYQQEDGGQFTNLPFSAGAFQVNASPVPEPSMAATFILAGAGLAVFGRGRQGLIRIFRRARFCLAQFSASQAIGSFFSKVTRTGQPTARMSPDGSAAMCGTFASLPVELLSIP